MQTYQNSPLLPGQLKALNIVEREMKQARYVHLHGRAGVGKSRVAAEIARRYGARHLQLADYIALASPLPAEKWRDRIVQLLRESITYHPALIIDDYKFFYSLDWSWAVAVVDWLIEEAQALGKPVLLVGRTDNPEGEPDGAHAMESAIDDVQYERGRAMVTLPSSLQPEDMVALGAMILGTEALAAIDCDVVQLHAAALMPREWTLICRLLAADGELTTSRALQLIDAHILHEGVRLNHVEELTFDALPGTEAIAEALEKHVAMPFMHPEEAERLGVKARRGVMLFGPPGTGKTSIGRALAHRMKGKFYLIDGSIPTEPPHIFTARVNAIIERAIHNAPSVLFIDDADNLFSIPYAAGIVRKLLSMLDGMESASASKVCVMMTVMDPIHVPDALVRSGRVELWLETTPPSFDVRRAMFQRWTDTGLPGHVDMDFEVLASRSEGFTPADIRRVMSDARLLLAQDIKAGRCQRDTTQYACEAIDGIRTMRTMMNHFLGDERSSLGATMGEIAA